jgi:Na+-driven multidrug efflux pump
MGPLIPGWVVLMVALARTNPGHLRLIGLSFTVFNLFAALVFVLIWRLNLWAARRLQRRIDELNVLQGQR